MATTTPTDCSPAQGLLPNQPYLALHPHYGMLMGVADFSADQAYHRGKMRLHNAWLHGSGVVWGHRVGINLPAGEVRVAPGLALDGHGRELHVDQLQCLHLGRWFAAHRDDAGFTVTEAEDGTVGFDAHVRLRHHACLTGPVPALADSCGSGSGVAYSRVYETVTIELVPGLAPALAQRHHLLRVLAGLDVPALDGDGTVQPDDQQALDARVAIGAASPADRLATAAAAFHHIAVLDSMADGPDPQTDPNPDDVADAVLFPAGAPPGVVLADLGGITLVPDGDGWRLSAATVDNAVRRVLLSSASLQGLAGGFLSAIV